MNYLINNFSEIVLLTLNHLYIVFLSTIPAIIFGVIFGIIFSRKKFINFGKALLTIFGILQSIPSIVFISLLFIYTGIGLKTSVIALFLYSIVPIIYNTTSSLIMVPDEVIDAGRGMGLSKKEILFKIELPLSLKGIFSGIRTSLTINIATATVATVIGVDTLGKIILIGLRVRKMDMLFVGGAIVAILAIFFDLILEKIENKILKWT
ncbi:MAG: ABC transporter permease [Caldisericia bacterium]|nr:ABC transporter permease [Caldisericia bacterium]